MINKLMYATALGFVMLGLNMPKLVRAYISKVSPYEFDDKCWIALTCIRGAINEKDEALKILIKELL